MSSFIKHYLLPFFLVYIIGNIFSCSAILVEQAVSGSILQPTNTTFDEDALLVFQANLDLLTDAEEISAQVEWVSSLEGKLGKGLRLARNLNVGVHEISLMYKAQVLDRTIVHVKSMEFHAGQQRVTGLGLSTNKLLLPCGKYSPFLYALDSKSAGINMCLDQASRNISPNIQKSSSEEKDSEIFGSKIFNYLSSSLPSATAIHFSSFKNHKSRNKEMTTFQLDPIFKQNYLIGDKRDFLIADTTGIKPNGYTVPAKLFFTSERLEIWLDDSAQIPLEYFDSFLEGIKKQAWPRVKTIWGDVWVDLDGNDALTVLITPIINQQGKAIGFFNPADLYPLNTNPSSSGYNPVSNEMDIIYLAAPEETGSFAYAASSILATFCHEATHLIGFSRSYYLPILNGQNVIREDLFLDEGLAHLTESLCGYGESGGNLAFLARYLENPGHYSLCKSDANGANDSVGKRGMAAAFLSWLFWQKGGAVWDNTVPGQIIDSGGLTFLRYFFSTNKRGMENISAAAGTDAGVLLTRWFREIDLQDRLFMEKPFVYNDPLTGEAITMSPFFGDLRLDETVFKLNGPVRKNLTETNILIPYSVIWGESFYHVRKDIIIMESPTPSGQTFACFDMF